MGRMLGTTRILRLVEKVTRYFTSVSNFFLILHFSWFIFLALLGCGTKPKGHLVDVNKMAPVVVVVAIKSDSKRIGL
jgi:hypothetical protein